MYGAFWFWCRKACQSFCRQSHVLSNKRLMSGMLRFEPEYPTFNQCFWGKVSTNDSLDKQLFQAGAPALAQTEVNGDDIVTSIKH